MVAALITGLRVERAGVGLFVVAPISADELRSAEEDLIDFTVDIRTSCSASAPLGVAEGAKASTVPGGPVVAVVASVVVLVTTTLSSTLGGAGELPPWRLSLCSACSIPMNSWSDGISPWVSAE